MALFWILTAVFCYAVYILIKKIIPRYQQVQLIEKIPGPPNESFILGHGSYLFASPEARPLIDSKNHKTYGNIFRIWMTWMPVVMIVDADFAEIFFTDKRLSSKGDHYRLLRKWIGLSLPAMRGQEWQDRRKLVTPAFHFSILKEYTETFIDNSIGLIEKLSKHSVDTPVNITRMMHLIALDNVCESAMGTKIGALHGQKLDFTHAVEGIVNLTWARLKQPWFWSDLYYLTSTGRNYRKYFNIMCELPNTAIKDRKCKRALRSKPNNVTDVDEIKEKKKLAFLDRLLDAIESESAHISDVELRNEVNTVITAGHGTTAKALSSALYLLGLHPKVQDKCYTELCEIFQGSDRRPTMDDLHKMKYLKQVILESLRLYPSIPVVTRTAEEELTLGPYKVPSGSCVCLQIYLMNKNPKYFPDPEKFDPDRFSSKNIDSRHPFAFVPFAAGPRNCIGQKFAVLQEKVILSYVLRNFTLESILERDKLRICIDLSMHPLQDIEIKLKPRNKQTLRR